MKIQTIPLSNIKPYWRNARKNERTVEVTKRSIESYGFNQPIVIDSKNVIIAGHARYKALVQLGRTEAACVVKDNLTEQEAKEYRIADNKTHELTIWDNDELMIEMREIDNNIKMQDYFPNINLGNWLDDEVGFNITNTSQEEYQKEEYQMGNKFKDAPQNEKTNVTCPHCYEEFTLDKKDI
tara:strand:+ start:83 stop:628 length:546 start_codon:yes stop_codon:yes gene_type:complete